MDVLPQSSPSPVPPPFGRSARLFAGGVLLIYAVAMGVRWEAPYILVEPGRATDVAPLIQAQGVPVHPPRGQLMFLTVTLSGRITPVEALDGWLDDSVKVIKEEVLFNPYGTNSREAVRRINLDLMRDSENTAIKVALERLGHTVEVTGGGVIVRAVLPRSAADGRVEVADEILAVDGQPVVTTGAVRDAVQKRKPGEQVLLTVARDEVEQTIELIAGDAGDGTPQIGVDMYNDVELRFPFPIDIDTQQVGGPSAGLAFTLAVIDTLTPGELTGGEKVAVTGTIEADGGVGLVGGVPQKATAARRAGATLFIVPSDELEEARQHAGGMAVEGVSTIDEAVAALARHGGEGVALQAPRPAS